MANMVGADIAALRDLGVQLSNNATKIDGISTQVNGALLSSPWQGRDADGFRNEWSRRLKPALTTAATRMKEAGLELKRQADDQERTSNDLGGGGVSGGPSGGPGGGLFGPLQPVVDIGMGIKKVVTAVQKARTTAEFLGLFTDAAKLAHLNTAAESAKYLLLGQVGDDLVKPGGFMAKVLGRFGRFGEVAGKWLGPIGGAFSIWDGMNSLISPEHEGWRGMGDRVAGALNVASGAGMIALAFGAATFLGPVGVGAIAVAGLGAAAWQLGNAVVDNWGSITDFTGRAASFAGDVGSAVVDGAVSTAKAGWNAITDAAGSVGNFFGGLFS